MDVSPSPILNTMIVFFVKSHSTLYHQHLQIYPILNTLLVFGKNPCIKHYQHLQCMNVQTADIGFQRRLVGWATAVRQNL